MTPIIAMAGLAEAACAWTLMICWAVLIASGILTMAAFLRRSQTIAFTAVGLLVLLGCLFQPWDAFAPNAAQGLVDPDYVYWRKRFQLMAACWAIGLAMTCGLFPFV